MTALDEEDSLQVIIADTIAADITLKKRLVPLYAAIARAAELLTAAYKGRKKAIFFGNGGSAADAQHLAAELVGRRTSSHSHWVAV